MPGLRNMCKKEHHCKGGHLQLRPWWPAPSPAQLILSLLSAGIWQLTTPRTCTSIKNNWLMETPDSIFNTRNIPSSQATTTL